MGTTVAGEFYAGTGEIDALRRVWEEVPTPCYVISLAKLRKNLKILSELEQDTGCRVLLAQKAFSLYHVYPLIGVYLSGATASGLYEARLWHEMQPTKENHVFSPAFRDGEVRELVKICDHIVFNSFRQYELFGKMAADSGVSCGLRLNPEHSTQRRPIYDPCSPSSRLGVRRRDFLPGKIAGLRGFHFHTLCEQNADALAETLAAVEEKFGRWLGEVEWLNFGGGHHITRKDYDLPLLKKCIRHVQDEYGLTVYIEPGEAVALDAGYLVTEVLEVQSAGNVICDTSAACHMPDVLEAPYRPQVLGAGKAGEKAYTYTLAGATCLSGDTIGEYSFDEPLSAGQRIVFGDMAIYTMVKNNTFNGMPLPSIIVVDDDGWRIVKEFGYEDFKSRL